MQVLQYVYDGIVIGSLYALVGLGLVIVFRSTNVLNFAQGAIATSAAYAAWRVIDAWSMPYAVGLVVAMVVGAAIGMMVGAVITFLAPRATHLEKGILALGFFLVIGWVNREVFGEIPQRIPQVFARPIEIGSFVGGAHGIYVVVVAVLAILATFYMLNRTRLGLGMRALSQDEETARTYGVSMAGISMASWGIASALGAASGVLVGSFIQVDHAIMTTIMLQSFTALVLGGFGSPIGAIVGGLFLGVSSSLIAGYLAPSYKNTMVFTLLLVVLVFRPHGLMGQKAIVVAETGSEASFPPLPTPGSWKRSSRVIGTALIATFIVVLPMLPHPFQLTSYSLVLSTAIIVISLGTFMGYVGEISLGHGALAAVGAYSTAILLDHAPGVPFVAVLAFAGLVAAVVGALVGWLTLRLQGLYLAIATLALTFVVTEVALQLRDLTGGATGISLPDPVFFGRSISSDRALYYLAAGTFAVVVASTAAIMRSSAAQKWVAIRDAPAAAASSGVSVNTQKVVAFTVSSCIAGIGGGTTALLLTHIGPFEYDLFFSVFLILAVVVGGAGSLLGALIGAALITLVPVAFSRSSGLTDAIFGTLLIVLMIVAPGGVRGTVDLLESARRRRGREHSGVDRDDVELNHASG